MFPLNKRIYMLCVCVCVCMREHNVHVQTHVTVLLWRSEDNSVKLVLSFHLHVDLGRELRFATFAMKVPVTTDSFHCHPFCIFSFYSKWHTKLNVVHINGVPLCTLHDAFYRLNILTTSNTYLLERSIKTFKICPSSFLKSTVHNCY